MSLRGMVREHFHLTALYLGANRFNEATVAFALQLKTRKSEMVRLRIEEVVVAKFSNDVLAGLSDVKRL